MAFHVACPITCRKICFCALGFPRKLRSQKDKENFLQEVSRAKLFLNDPWLINVGENATIQVKVPKVVAASSPLPPPPPQFLPDVSVGAGDEAAAAASAQVKGAALQKQAAATSMVAEDYAWKFESGDLVTSVKDVAGEEQVQSTVKVMCRLCFSGEYEGSERARKMLSCNTCGKKYHRSCLKSWSKNRGSVCGYKMPLLDACALVKKFFVADFFHWSSWTCPSCRTCEVCRRTGDPNKFMFCKRCDGAYHCYCQQPPHKNVGHGPYLCPKHTKCHSCASSVPGNGLSVRWFLGYTCCDACGRLFVKGNYCPVCLKVYRDSESTPMVCCDVCHKWVHCPCDGISDSKYMQFQVDGNLQYVCPTCRGECCQVRSLGEAVQELWRLRDESDKDLIASLRAAAGLPTQDEIFDISPFSDDEESRPMLKNEFSRLKFSLKALGDKSPKKNKESGKKSSKKKSDEKKGNENEGMRFSIETDTLKSPIAEKSLKEGLSDGNEAAVSKHKSIDEVSVINTTKTSGTIKIKSSNRSHDLITNSEETGISSVGAPKTAQGPKLVIHLGGRSRTATSPPRYESKRGLELASVKCAEDATSQMKHHELIDRLDPATKLGDQKGHKKDRTEQAKDSKLIKLKNSVNTELADGYQSVSPKNTTYSVLGKRSAEDGASARSESEIPFSKRTKYPSIKHAEDDDPFISGNLVLDDSSSSLLRASSRDCKPSLKFKIPKTSNNGSQKNVPAKLSGGINQNSSLPGKENITYTRGQRSKRRKPGGGDKDGGSQWGEDNTVKDFTDANWILQKLGKDAAGKRVEIHQPSNNSWHRGTVIEIIEGTSVVYIALDDGKADSFELGKQGIRFVSQKQKH